MSTQPKQTRNYQDLLREGKWVCDRFLSKHFYAKISQYATFLVLLETITFKIKSQATIDFIDTYFDVETCDL